jgi:acyl-CoA synthetase (AMP-forming)/AMP-acid ligase II
MLNYIDLLDRAARTAGERPALIDAETSLTYRELTGLTNRLAQALVARGFKPASPYAVLSPNTGMALAALIGGLRAGGAWSNINLRSGVATNTDVLNRGGCRALFFHSSVAAQVEEIMKGVPTLDILICLDKTLGKVPSLQQFIEGASDGAVNVRLPEGAVGFQGSTGGTTGLPKITQGGQDFLSWNALGLMNALSEFDADNPPVNLAVAPITHAGGIVAMAALAMGGTVVMMPTADLGELLRNVPRYGVSLLFLPPTVIYMLMAHPDCASTDFSSLRYLLAAAAPFSTEKIRRAHAIFGPVICQAFGQTESGFPLTYMSKSAVTAALQDPALSARLKSVGRPTTSVIAIDIMSEEGVLLEPDAIGEIVVRGPTTMFRYLDDPENSAAVQGGGWQHTGDLGYRDKDGFIYLVDRKRDLIITGGFNVYPREVEDALGSHPAVAVASVFGIADDRWGEAVTAAVVLREGVAGDAEALIAHVRKLKGAHQTPKMIHFVDALPLTPVGKPDKKALRVQYARVPAES